MGKLPEQFIRSLEGVPGFDRASFELVHEKGEQVTSIRINPGKPLRNLNAGLNSTSHNTAPETLSFELLSPVPWSEYGYYLTERPSFTFDPFFHAGTYYVQEASSMFIEQALKQLTDLSKPLKVLDLSAAPGGKSTHIQSLITQDSLLVANEVIRTRSNILRDNIIKWGCSNVLVSNNDPSAFQKIPAYFDVLVIDAPCSGSGLFRRDEEAINEWSLNNVQLCSQRQQRILADALPALKENGLLVYSTCSYSAEEDEQIADWLVNEMEMVSERIKISDDWNIVETESHSAKAYGYRFFRDKVKGEGFFLACFRKKSGTDTLRLKASKLEMASSKEKKIIEPFVHTDLLFFRHGELIIGAEHSIIPEIALLKNILNLQYAGVWLGEIMKEKLVPHHALAVSTAIARSVPSTALSYEDSIKYLQRQEINNQPAVTGWQTVTYNEHNLGWINALKNRINNYYPKDLRILKLRNDAASEK